MKPTFPAKSFVAAALAAVALIAIGAIFLLASASGGTTSGHSVGAPTLPSAVSSGPETAGAGSSTSSGSTGSTSNLPVDLGVVAPVSNPSPPASTTTVVVSAPATSDVPPVGAGKPASFWTLKVTYPAYCTLGSTVTPVLTWNAADTSTVAVSVDKPTTVGSYGFFGSVNTLTMPSIACTGTKGLPLPTHEYELDAFGTNNAILHVVEKVNITISPKLTYTVPAQINLPNTVLHP